MTHDAKPRCRGFAFFVPADGRWPRSTTLRPGWARLPGRRRYGFRRGVLPDMQPVFGKAAGWRAH
ncbi:hypothetical protein DESPIG_02215 [Desulfovibrio piger ATCC 29098]|uniref:Uncharacterized protein n=1 Tax=Desulfovibrio piger ATCC 29098 TaxID=411464 RepID=B6WVU7_9BACT|nr:hypothetical protein DESPIG_02215 [Desulfovibrio piger ATCC 29098]